MSNAEILQQNNVRLNVNNTDLSSVLDTINNLPENQRPEELNINSSLEEQSYEGLFNKVNVSPIETESINIVPSSELQTKEGLYNKVTVAGDENLASDNIKKGTSIFGVEGNADVLSFYITDASYLFNEGHRINQMEEILSICKNITDCDHMFYGCRNLTNLDLSNFDTSNVTDMRYMFNDCSKLTSLDLSNFDTSNVTNMISMFMYNSRLENVNLSSFNTEKVTNMSSMFRNCSYLTYLDLSNFNTSNVIDMSYMFYACRILTLLDLSNFNTSNVTNISSMFQECKELIELNINNIDFGKVTNVSYIFYNNSKLENLSFAKNLGKGYTYKQSHYSSYRLDLSPCINLTHDSLMDIINKLYDLNITYDVANGGTLYTQQLILGSTNLAKLTAEEIAIATNKGWNVS